MALSATAFTGAAGAGSPACANRVNNTFAKLTECVTLEGVRSHQAAFQAIADANNGIRTSGTPGYDASAAYVAGKMTAAGYNVTVQTFQFQTFIVLSPTVLRAGAPAPARTGREQHHVLLGQRRRDRPRDSTRAPPPMRRPAARPRTSPASRQATSR